MTMGQRILRARQEAGVSQRELAGEEMTRNMLSALEHDAANPSVATLRYLSEKLCKPISYFLGEDVIAGADAGRMELARTAYRKGEYQACLDLTKQIGEVFRTEAGLLRALSLLELARVAVEQSRIPYAKELLAQCAEEAEGTPYFPAIRRDWILLMAMTDDGRSLRQLHNEDEALLLRAQRALAEEDPARAEALLEAVENRGEDWHFLRGEIYYHKKEYENAIACYHRAEAFMPEQTGKRLEICYREAENYKMAYYYATRNK